MSRWWRAYEEAVDDPKLQLLQPPLFKAWFNLLCLASANGGVLPHAESIAFKLRTTEAKIGSILEELISRELLDDFDGTLRPHNWNGRQYKSDTSTDRVKEFRERERNVSRNESETPPETEEQITETDKKELRPKRVRTTYSEEFQNRFWKPYPRTPLMSKKQAFREWGKLSDEDRNLAIAAVPQFREFLASRPDHGVVHAERFLRDRRFDGFAEAVEVAAVPLSGYYAEPDSAELDAWNTYSRTTKGINCVTDKRGGWRFPTQWPPGHETTQAA